MRTTACTTVFEVSEAADQRGACKSSRFGGTSPDHPGHPVGPQLSSSVAGSGGSGSGTDLGYSRKSTGKFVSP